MIANLRAAFSKKNKNLTPTMKKCLNRHILPQHSLSTNINKLIKTSNIEDTPNSTTEGWLYVRQVSPTTKSSQKNHSYQSTTNQNKKYSTAKNRKVSTYKIINVKSSRSTKLTRVMMDSTNRKRNRITNLILME